MLKIFPITFLFLTFFNTIAISQEKIVFFDIDNILNNSIAGKKILLYLDEINKENISNLKKNELEIKNSETADFLIFMDIANIWGVDYDSSLNDSSKIRSSIGLGVDWFTVVGPLNFSLAYPITKDSNDITESFRFNLGTTF